MAIETKAKKVDSVPPSGTAKKPKNWKKIILVIVAAIVVLFVILLLVVVNATNAPKKISDELVADIQAKNSNAAYSLFSTAAKTATSQSDLNGIIDQLGPLLNGAPKTVSKEVKGETGSAASATVVYDIHGSDGLTHRLTVNLVKDGSDWKILNFESVRQ